MIARGPGNDERSLAIVEAARPTPPPGWFELMEVGETLLSPDLVLAHAPNSLAAEQFRALRYRLDREPDAQVVAVTSARANEGKSVTAANLALALAEGARVRVVLVDAALRSPSQSALFGLPDDSGLTTVLSARRTDDEARAVLHRTSQNLFVLTAGPRVATPHALLGSDVAARLLGSLRRTFRHVVVDASAVFGPAETLAWHGMIDRYVLVARRGLTTTDDLARAADRIDRDKVLGVAFVGARAASVGA